MNDTREKHAIWAGGSELFSHTLEGNSVPVVGALRSVPACLGFLRHLYYSTGGSSLSFFTRELCAFSGWGPMAQFLLGLAPGEEKSRLLLRHVTNVPIWKLNWLLLIQLVLQEMCRSHEC